MSFRALVVDDEEPARSTLIKLLRSYCDPAIRIVGEVASAEEITSAIAATSPDVVFLDIEMDGINSLDILQTLPGSQRQFLFIVVTGHAHYGVMAVNTGALYYLLKPIDIDELQEAVLRLENELLIRDRFLSNASSSTESQTAVTELHIPRGGKAAIPFYDLMYCTPAGNYCQLYLYRKPNIITYGSMRKLVDQLPDEFIRIHHSCIVNICFVENYVRAGSEGYVVLRNGEKLAVSRRYRKKLEMVLHLFTTAKYG